jgi:hypothetical protein
MLIARAAQVSRLSKVICYNAYGPAGPAGTQWYRAGRASRDSPRISLAEERQIAAPYTVDSRSDYWIYANLPGLLL